MNKRAWSLGGMKLAEEIRSTRRKISFSSKFSTKNPTWTCLEINHELAVRSRRPTICAMALCRLSPVLTIFGVALCNRLDWQVGKYISGEYTVRVHLP
jgi:hypothetical protein